MTSSMGIKEDPIMGCTIDPANNAKADSDML